MKEEPPLSVKCKDKFLIQSTIISPDKDAANLAELWSGENSQLLQHKIRVVYLPPDGQTVPEEEESHLYAPSRYETVRGGMPMPTNGDADHSADHAPFADSADVTAPEAEVHVDAPSTPPQGHEDEPHVPPPQPEEELEEEVQSTPLVNVNVHQPAPPTPPSMPIPVPAPPMAVGPEPDEELAKRLDEAHAEIERLRNLISSMPGPSTAAPTTSFDTSTETETNVGFRRRGGPRSVLSDDDASTVTPTEYGSLMDEAVAQPDGVPLQVVIIIALGVFITTYLFF